MIQTSELYFNTYYTGEGSGDAANGGSGDYKNKNGGDKKEDGKSTKLPTNNSSSNRYLDTTQQPPQPVRTLPKSTKQKIPLIEQNKQRTTATRKRPTAAATSPTTITPRTKGKTIPAEWSKVNIDKYSKTTQSPRFRFYNDKRLAIRKSAFLPVQ